MKLLLQAGYAAVAGSLAVQPFDILHEYALRASRLRVPVSLHVCTLSRRTFMNNAGQAQPTRTVPNATAISNHFFIKSWRCPREARFGVRSSENLEPSLVSLERRLGPDGGLNKFSPSSEIGRATDLIRVVMVGPFNDIEGFWWLGCFEDLSAQFEGDNVVFVAVNDQLRERELRKAIDQCEGCPEQPMDRQSPVMELGHRFDRRKR